MHCFEDFYPVLDVDFVDGLRALLGLSRLGVAHDLLVSRTAKLLTQNEQEVRSKANEVSKKHLGFSFEEIYNSTTPPAVHQWAVKILVASMRRWGNPDLTEVARQGAEAVVKLEERIAELEAKLKGALPTTP